MNLLSNTVNCEYRSTTGKNLSRIFTMTGNCTISDLSACINTIVYKPKPEGDEFRNTLNQDFKDINSNQLEVPVELDKVMTFQK